jgi:hypothetical protein
LRLIELHHYPGFWDPCFHFVATLPHQSRQSAPDAVPLARDRVRVSRERNVHVRMPERLGYCRDVDASAEEVTREAAA